MLPSLGEAVLKLRADSTQLAQDVNAARSDVEASLLAVGKSMTRVGAIMTGAVTLPLIGLGTIAINATEDYYDAIEKIPDIFGTASQEVIDFSSDSAESLGISQAAALETLGVFGLFFTNMGVGTNAAAVMSESLTTLASDIAEYKDITQEAAVDMLLSGLAGRGAGLRQLGIEMNDTVVQAKALELGLADAVDQLTEDDLIVARYALIMAGTADIQGEFGRSVDEVGVQLAIMKAHLLDVSRVLGIQLIPLALKAVQALSKLVTWFENISPGGQKAIVTIGIVVAAIGPLLTVIGSVIRLVGIIGPLLGGTGGISAVLASVGTAAGAAGVAIGTIILPILLIIGALVLLYLAFKNNWGGITTTLTQLHAIITFTFNGMLEDVKTTISQLGFIIKFYFTTLVEDVKQKWNEACSAVSTAWDSVWNAVAERLNDAWNVIKDTVSGIIQNIRDLFNIDWSELGGNVINGIIAGLRSGIAAIISAAADVVGAVTDAFKDLMGIHSPSLLMEQEIGLPAGQGVGIGLIKGLGGFEAKLNQSLSNSLAGVRNTSVPGTTNNSSRQTNINVYNPVPEPASSSVDLTLRKLSYLGIPT